MPLEAGDETAINDVWRNSIYFAVWQQITQHEVGQRTSLKLVVAENQDKQILGLLRMGDNIAIRALSGKLNTQSVLETARCLRHLSKAREYQGIGKVLVPRLIAESIWQGQGGLQMLFNRFANLMLSQIVQ